MSTIRIIRKGITDFSVDAMVNAANSELQAGGGVCGAIFKTAGYQELQKACDQIGHCDTGSAVITPGFHSKAKYIVHAVGPIWQGGNNGEPQMLYGCYYTSLRLAMKNKCHSIVFPLISSGIFGYPKDKAWRKAIKACHDFIHENPDADIEIIFAVLDDDMRELGQKTLRDIAPEDEHVFEFSHPEPEVKTVVAKKSDWKTVDLPEKHDTFVLHRLLTEENVAILHMGNIPKEMEDKWFWYCEGNKLYAHRSWTGFCIYVIQMNPGCKEHVVSVNRDPEQYKCTSIEEDEEDLNHLLDWWTKDKYDYYHEWLAETYKALKKSGK